MNYNKNSNYGASLMASLPLGLSGKIFCVGDSSTANLDMLRELFDADPDGDLRFFSTIDAAVGACTANAGDVILVAPGHTETIATATSLVVDVAGVSIIGVGSGSDRPLLDFRATAGSVEMDAANTSLKNLRLLANVSAVVIGINVDAAYVTLEDLEFDFNETGDDFITMIDVDAVDDCVIRNCKLIAEDAAGCAEAIRLDACDNVVIEGCHLYGDFTDGAIIGEGAAGTNLLIKDNVIYNSDTTAGFVIDLNVAFTGLLVKNSCGTLFATAPETTLDPGSCLCIENYVANAVDESAALVPVTVST